MTQWLRARAVATAFQDRERLSTRAASAAVPIRIILHVCQGVTRHWTRVVSVAAMDLCVQVIIRGEREGREGGERGRGEREAERR
jgi:hypothetical protein